MPLQATSGAASYDGFGGGVAAVPNYIEDVFSTQVYTGTGATNNIVNGIDLASKGGLVWTKARSTTSAFTFAHALIDTLRGVGVQICSDRTDANYTQANSLTAFNADGYTLGTDSGGQGRVNNTSYGTQTYASWTFRKQPKFFDVVTWTADSSGTGQAVSHNLGSIPGCIIVKATNAGSNWFTWHIATDITVARTGFQLNSTAASALSVNSTGQMTSTEFFSGQLFDSSYNRPVTDGTTYVAYLFAHNAGGFGLTGTDNVISCGSYSPSAGAPSTFVNLGYEPQFVMIKNTNISGSAYTGWGMFDNMRGVTTPGDDQFLLANSSVAESNGAALGIDSYVDFNATGFTANATTLTGANGGGHTYIYIAIRRGPMKVPTDATKVFSVESYNQTSASDPAFNLGNVADMGFRRLTNLARNWTLQSRLTGNQGLTTNTTDAESTQNYGFWDNNLGWYQGEVITPPYSQSNWFGWTFARAPSFFDEVCYTGTGSATTFNHNLGVTPELMIVKRRSTAGNNWCVYSNFLTATNRVFLNTTAATTAQTSMWNDTEPTSTVFTVGSNDTTNASGSTFVNYLFATCAGVSKVGSYTGTGATQTINCGFAGGARFVLIKRTDSTGDWYVWDSARGIVSGNDPYLLLNSTAAEVTTTDYIDTYSAGFEISSTAPAAINASGGTFIFLAIA